MAEILVDDPRKKLYSALVSSSDKELAGQVKKYSYNKFNSLLDNNDFVQDLFMDISERGVVLDPKNPEASKDPYQFVNTFVAQAPPTPKPQAAPKQEFMEVPALEEQEAYVPEPQPLVGSPEYDKQLQKQYGGMAPTLGATFGGVPAAFETKEQKKQEQLSPAFKAQQLAFEDVPIAEEQRRAQREFAKATKQQQQAALRGGTGFELQQERANEARESTQKLKDFGSYIGATFDNMIDKAKGAERIFAAKQKALLTFGDRRKKAEEEEKRVKQQIVNYVDKLDADFAAKQTDYNIEGNLFDAIRKGQWDRIPEAFAYNLAQIGVQALAATSTGGYSMFAQVFPDMYKAGVEEIAKKTKTTPEQVIASGNDKELLSYIGGGINGYIEYLSGGILGKAMRSEGAYKFLRDKALEKIGKTKWKQAAASAAALGGVSGIEGLTEVGQGLTEVITPQIAAADTFKGARENIYRELQKPETQRRLASEFVGGAAGGGGIVGGGRALSRTLEGDFTYGDVRKAPQRADYDVVQTDNKIQERNKIAQAMEEAVKANPEAEGQIRQQYQKRINEAAPTDEEVLSAYDGLAVLPETEEKNTIRENLEAYMAEKGIAPQAEAEAISAEEVQGTGKRIFVDSLEEVPAEYRNRVMEITTGPLSRFGVGKKQYSYTIPIETVDITAPEVTTEEDLAEDIPFEEVPPVTEEAPTEEELSLEDQLMGLVPQEETASAPAEEEVAPEAAPVASEIEKQNTFTRDDLKTISEGTALAKKGAEVMSSEKVESQLRPGDEVTFFAEKERKGVWDGKMIREVGTDNPWGVMGILADVNGFIRNDTKINEQAAPAPQAEEVVAAAPVEEVAPEAPAAPAPKGRKKKEAPKPEAKKEEASTEEKSVSGTPQEGDKVEIAPQREGGSPRNMVFKDGEWKQNVGGDIVKVGPAVQQQAQEAFGGKAEVKPAETKEGKKAEVKEEKVTPAPKKGVFADLTEIGGIKFGKDGVAKAVPIKGRIEKVEKAMGVDGIFKIYTLSTQYGVPIEVYGDIDNFVEGKPVEGSEVSFTANVRNLDYRLRVIGPKTEYKQPKPATTTKEEKPAPAVQPTPPRGKGATILPSVDADKADAQLYILQSNNYYTLWYKRKQVDEKTGKTLWSYSNYLTILSQDLDDARTKALDYLNKIASGEFLSTAFVGKNTQGLTDAKTIALQEGVLTPETQPISKSKTPGVEKTFGIGKYSNLTIDELLDKDPDYAQWFVNNYTSRGAEQTKAIIKGDPRYQDYINIKRDIEELERARIEAYEAREAERKAGGKVKVATLVRGEEGEIKEVIEETEVPKKKVEKKERRLVKDQITDIVPPQAKAEDKVDANLKPQMFAAQINGANTAIASLDKYGVVLNGDGAGVGKTRQIIAVAKYYADKGKPVVIISENAALGKPFEGGKKPALGGSMAKDSEAMGVSLTLLTDDEKVQPGGIYVSTYNRIQDADVPEGAIVIFDESHNLVNTFGRTPGGEEIEEERQWEAKFRPMLKKAGAVAYYTATPADKPHQLAYLYKVLGFNSPEDFLSEMMLNGAVIKERKFGRTKIKYYDVPKSKAGRTNLYKWVNGLMVKAGEQGRFIKREISYEGTDVQFQDIKGTDENKNEYAKEFNKVLDDMSDAEMMDYRLLAPGSYILYAAELAKIGEAVNIVKKQLAQGRKSIIFVSRINPMEIRGRREQFDGELGGPEVVGEIPSPVPMLEEALRKEGISFVGLHSKAKTTSQKAQKQFAEEADVLIASLESGGTGINLDDTVGDNPRTEVFLFSPYRGISTIQGMGRIWRASTIQNDNNPNRYIFVTASDIAPDLKRSGVLAKKLQLMNAAIGGTAVSKLPMSKVSYSSEELIGIELPDDADEESAIFREKTGILKPVSIKWNISRKGGYFADATADLLEWMERGGPERTGLDVRVFKTEEGKWIALAGKDYKAEEFAPENIANEAAPSFTSSQSSEAATAFDKAKTSKGFDKKYGKGAYKALSDITKNFDEIMDKVSDKIKQDCL